MPLGRFFLFAGAFVFPLVGGRDCDVGDRIAAGHITCLGIASEIADDDDLIDGCHATLPRRNEKWKSGGRHCAL